MLLTLTLEMALASFPTSPATDYLREERVNESWCEGKSVRNFFCATFHDDAPCCQNAKTASNHFANCEGIQTEVSFQCVETSVCVLLLGRL